MNPHAESGLTAGAADHQRIASAIYYAEWDVAEPLVAAYREQIGTNACASLRDPVGQAWLTAFTLTLGTGRGPGRARLLGDVDEADEVFLCLDDVQERAAGLAYLAMIAAGRGEGERAVELGSLAADLADLLTEPTPAARWIVRALTVTSMELGLEQQALSYLRRGVEMARAIGDEATLAGQLHRLAGAHNEYAEQARQEGRPEVAAEHFGEAEQLAHSARALGVTPDGEESMPALTLGWAQVGLEQYDAAISELGEVLADARRHGLRWVEGTALLGLGRAHRRRGDPVEAEKALGDAVRILSDMGQMRFRQPALLELVGLHRSQGEPARALPHLLAYLDAESAMRHNQRKRWLALFADD